MKYIYYNKLNNKSEFNLIHDILNTSKRTKNINNNCPPIQYRCMDARRDKAKYKIRIRLDNGCSPIIALKRLTTKPKTKKYYVMQWHTQSCNTTTNLKVKIYFTLNDFSMTKIVMWEFHMGDSTKGIYDMLLGRYLLTVLGLNFKCSKHVKK